MCGEYVSAFLIFLRGGHVLMAALKAREYLKNAFDMCPVHAERNLR